MTLKSTIKSFRLISLTVSATPWLACLFVSLMSGTGVNYIYSSLSLIGILFLQLGVNLFNDVSDYSKGIDIPGEFGGSGVLVNKELTPFYVGAMGTVFFAIAISIAVYLYQQNTNLLPIIILGAFSSLLYSLPFFGLKYIALGDIAVFIGCGPVLSAGYAICNGVLLTEHIIIGIFFGFYAIGILHTNNMEDISIDTKVNVKTMATLLGFEKSRKYLLAVYIIGSLSLLTLSFFNIKLLISFMLHLIAIPLGKKLVEAFFATNDKDDKSLKLLRLKAAEFHLASGILVCIGLILGFLI
jgi:1,4-dihydroxy-2-naphthoate octaprenyltransferase